LPKTIDKALYLDVDMLVLADLYDLYKTDISQYILAAVTDPRVKTFDNHWGGILNYQSLGLNGLSPYFNTGLLLINTKKWRDSNVTDQIVATINANVKFANYPDQYGLNIVMADKWLKLDDAWNNFVTVHHPAPKIIHFVDRKPIYKAYKNSEHYKVLFYQFLKATEWKNTRPISEPMRYAKKLSNIILKFRKLFG
jgi:lipopolysaccharide biosynthesis glycosyltransferase